MLTFHVESHHLPRLIEAVGALGEKMSRRPDFRGFVCLDHDSIRHEIIVMSLWDGEGLEDTRGAFEKARDQIAKSIDLGMRSSEYDVLCFVPGDMPSGRVVVPVLAL